ncbi:MAG: YaiO family outer membrane beta-barrel protein [Acidobacteriota bacterium]|nr:YaiO family outer membrane beta-barrel protein [Acidobacteriota bacterium]
MILLPLKLAAAVACTLALAAQAGAEQNLVTKARALALAGQRVEAIAALQQSLATAPGDSDARALLGTILSWEGRHDEARRELEAVLSGSPVHGDALPALINVEMWSGHPGRAEALARRGLQQRPADTSLMAALARALVDLERTSDAAAILERLLEIDPRHQQGRTLRATLQQARQVWQFRAAGSYDGFSDRDGWREAQMSLGRVTPAGSILLRGVRAERFGLADHQIELEMYPRIRPGTYAYVAGAYSPAADLFPRRRYVVDLHQSLGAGFEASAGVRRLSFGDGVTIYAGSLSKYYGHWLFSGRMFLTPGDTGTSRTAHASVRRYFGDRGTYAGVRYGRGAWREEILNVNDLEALASDVGAAEAVFLIGRRLELNATGSYGREDRLGRGGLRRYSLSSGIGFRF